MKIKRGSINFAIPRSMLQIHIQSIGHESFLTPEQDSGLYSRLFRLANVGMPLTYDVYRNSVYTFCKQNHIRVPRDK
ncbi:hypothetical protein PR048_013639 [Dryococelus australis]|uniref:Uncharacterized protein n=1 Tax=Dryococelus australis TaxID=614101 RepID=A0ABQ9HTK3_9NEOP|nr:hypothetical protein PR048_013639 [Dryococelus australis]